MGSRIIVDFQQGLERIFKTIQLRIKLDIISCLNSFHQLLQKHFDHTTSRSLRKILIISTSVTSKNLSLSVGISIIIGIIF
jgi:hypothetical protein